MNEGTVRLPYRISKEWNKKARGHLFAALVALGTNVYLLMDMESRLRVPWFIIGVTLFLVILETTRAVNYFKRPERDYAIIEDTTLFLDRGLLLPRKKVPLSMVKDTEHQEEEFVIKQNHNQEDIPIEIDALEEKDFAYLRQTLDNYLEESV
ncbi:hypothetical protein [Salimicrobium halophilum]|uniref:Uncharacterized protein n=1 Tax=Salimicrobium halophilum TaxID=86666 RepID=A0A1G8RAD7_9BACI|nr:hypothetical protein [Salimicrobium halophilum]SDJ13889.1 hypothetical protein SAMN04490247_0919 [Salimicrobium halophilum]